MKRIFTIALFLPVLALGTICVMAQSFKKGSILLNLSEGSAYTNFSTLGNEGTKSGSVDGTRDPITIEYGISQHIGLGISMGGDIFYINPNRFYGFSVPENRVKLITSELTLDFNYHLLSTRHIDIAAFCALGPTGVSVKGNSGDYKYQYSACGGIIRTGIKARYYFLRRFSFMGIVSAYSASVSADNNKGNTVGVGAATKIKGYAIEFGPGVRIRR